MVYKCSKCNGSPTYPHRASQAHTLSLDASKPNLPLREGQLPGAYNESTDWWYLKGKKLCYGCFREEEQKSIEACQGALRSRPPSVRGEDLSTPPLPRPKREVKLDLSSIPEVEVLRDPHQIQKQKSSGTTKNNLRR